MEKIKEVVDIHSFIPADVPKDKLEKFKNNFIQATGGSGRLLLFAGDQKLEHLNADFSGPGISEDDADPVHLFRIASKAKIGVFATQMGLISRYCREFPTIPFLVKLNSKTNLVSFEQNDPLSSSWFTMEQVLDFAESSHAKILGVGYTVYLGSDYEAEMLREAAQIVHKAHRNGLLAVLWIYPKGKAVKNEYDVDLIAGAAGVAACLGADFVKLKVPKDHQKPSSELLPKIVAAAGNTGVLCEGGSKEDEHSFLTELYHQIHTGGTRGNGIGRNIHQRNLKEAIYLANAIYSIIVEGKTVEEVVKKD